jgi:hypothetical protein
MPPARSGGGNQAMMGRKGASMEKDVCQGLDLFLDVNGLDFRFYGNKSQTFRAHIRVPISKVTTTQKGFGRIMLSKHG